MAKSKMKEPPMGSVIIDTYGSAWQRHPTGWCISGSDGWAYPWKRLVRELYGKRDTSFTPTEEWKSAVRFGEKPIIVYVPNEELLVGEDDE